MLRLLLTQIKEYLLAALRKSRSPQPIPSVYWTDSPWIWSKRKGGYWRSLNTPDIDEPTEDLVIITKETREGNTSDHTNR